MCQEIIIIWLREFKFIMIWLKLKFEINLSGQVEINGEIKKDMFYHFGNFILDVKGF